MGHAIDYITVNERKDIMNAASRFAARNVDREENPDGSYHGNMTIHDSPICESWEEAKGRIEGWDLGFYSDHAVQFKDKDTLKPTKAMLTLQARAEKLLEDEKNYIESHALKNRKSEFIGCKGCGSKLATQRLHGTRCPLCGTELRADYIVERIRKYDNDYANLMKQYSKMKSQQTGKCPVKWLVKVEVHC